MSKYEESFYEKYFFHVWLVGSFVFSLFYIYVIDGVEFSIENLFPGIFVLAFVQPFVAMLIYTLFVMFTFGSSLFIDGIKDKDPWGIFGAFWIFTGVFMYFTGGSA